MQGVHTFAGLTSHFHPCIQHGNGFKSSAATLGECTNINLCRCNYNPYWLDFVLRETSCPETVAMGASMGMLTTAKQEPANFSVSLLGSKVQAIHVVPRRHICIRAQLKQHFHVFCLHEVGKATS